jgi:hypothetical protein
MAMTCPSCGGDLVELERSGVHLDACRECRGVWLDRGELDRVVERERRGRLENDEDFIREMTGRGDDYRSQRKPKKRKGFLEELFD